MRGDSETLHGLTLRIEPGQHTVIVGPNGAGKSSLGRMIHRDDYPLAHSGGYYHAGFDDAHSTL